MTSGYLLTYTATLTAADGSSFVYGGQQTIAAASPQTGDLTTAATAMGTDIGDQMSTGPNAFPIQAADDGDSGGAQA
jgi:hypothetical protein